MNRDNDKGKVLIKRTAVMASIQLLLLLVIIMRLYYLQVFQSDRFKMLADENRISTRILVPPRGIIYDRNGEMLATNQQNFQAMIVAEQTTDVQETLDKFKQLMPLTEAEERRIKKDLQQNKSFIPVKIKDNLSWEEVSKIQLHAPDISGIFIDEGLSRYYPYGKKVAHVVGYVAAVSESDIKTGKGIRKDPDPLLDVPGFKIGKAGIEKMLEKELRGKGGNLKLEVNAYGRVMKEIERVPGVPGSNVTLTIDARLQEKAFDLFKEESGALILLDVHTGEILAFVSAPSFDPNLFSQGLSTKEWNELNTDEKKPLSNKAISGTYSPGSTFKMLVALAGLEARAILAQTTISCSGQMFLGNHAFHCWKKGGHGSVNIVEAIEHSCDIFFYEASQRTGIEKIAEMARRFGLGKRIGVGFDNEADGIIPDKEWKMKRFGEPWQQGETLISGIGQGYITTTPIQLVTMLARMVNGGYAVMPSFLKKEIEEPKPDKINVLSAHLEVIKEGMYSVVNKPHGTAFGSAFDYKGQKMGGKTGTTQVRRISMKERQTGIIKDEDLPWRYRNHALFLGYAPHDNPKYAVAVLVEHGISGSKTAAPIARDILLETIKLDPTKKVVE